MLDLFRRIRRAISGSQADNVHHTNYYPCVVRGCNRIGRTYKWGHATVVRLCYVHADKMGLSDKDLQ